MFPASHILRVKQITPATKQYKCFKNLLPKHADTSAGIAAYAPNCWNFIVNKKTAKYSTGVLPSRKILTKFI